MSSIGDVLRPRTSINLLHHKFNIVWAVHLTRTCHLGGSCPLFSITSHKRTCYLDGSCHLLAQCRIRTSPRCRRPRSLQLRALNANLHVLRECQTGIQRVYVPVSGKLCVIYTNSQQRIYQARSYMYMPHSQISQCTVLSLGRVMRNLYALQVTNVFIPAPAGRRLRHSL